MSNKSGTSVISNPKGGGAMHGIGEKFSPDLHTGTGNFTIPITLPSGRNGFQPQLNLVYSTGNGNSEFGLGWNLSIPGISRKTSKGVPIYDDARDTFILSGVEDLVAINYNPMGTTRYHPRTEGLFARIEHHKENNQNYWEVRSKDGLISFYGTKRPTNATADWIDPAIIGDPNNKSHVFSWKLTQTTDPFKNIIVYEYETDSKEKYPHHWSQLYLKEIKYADYQKNNQTEFFVTVNFDYTKINERPDSFSEYRSGFEIRTRKRYNKISIETHADKNYKVRDYEFRYLDERNGLPAFDKLFPLNKASLLSQIFVFGYGDDGKKSQELPPLEFSYTNFEPEERDFFPLTGPAMPTGSLGRPEFEMADLFGKGLPDILEMNGSIRYWRNLGDGKFDLPQNMRDFPAGLSLADPGVQLIDADGDGRVDLLVSKEGLSGYFPLRFDGLWDQRSFQKYEFAPSFNFEDPEVKLVDIDGDGVTDVIRSGSRLECYFNDHLTGWNPEKTRRVEREALEFPNVNFSDWRVKWGDMNGDGLQDILLVYEGSVSYWPSFGHGNWGRQIFMTNSPRFPYGYDTRRILVGDVDGDGLADIVYVDNTKTTLWINQSGNSWSAPITIQGTPPVTDMDSVRLVDMLGSGVSGILWSADAITLQRDNMFFFDFTGGIKPYLLCEMNNHMGAITKVGYTSSTHFYQEDYKQANTRWKTPLPFPVQVVAYVETIDELSSGKLTTQYKYHHGYWDGAEREFRGFGMVEQFDTETFEIYNGNGLHGDKQFIKVTERFSPPTLSKTWFHQGPVGDEFGEWEETDFKEEFWQPDPNVLFRPQLVTDFLKALSRRVKRDALRTLRGSILRTELYALDGSERETRPYAVTEFLMGVCEVIFKNGQPELSYVSDSNRAPGNYRKEFPSRIFFPHALGQRTTQWERGNEPMTQISFTDDYSAYGQAQEQINIAVPRKRNYLQSVSTPTSSPYLITHTLTDYAQRDDNLVYIVDRVCRTTTYEIKNDGTDNIFILKKQIESKALDRQENVISQTLNFFDGNAFTGLGYKQIGDFGALTRTESLVFTYEILQKAYGANLPVYLKRNSIVNWPTEYPTEFKTKLPALAGYKYKPDQNATDGYFITTDRREYDFQGLVIKQRDPLGGETTIEYESPYNLLPINVIDPIGLTTKAEYGYRLMQPSEITDVNDNVTRFDYSPIGLLKNTWLAGNEGDQVRPSIQMEYGFLAFYNSPRTNRQPVRARTIRYIHHDSETHVSTTEVNETIITIEYTDGFGRLLQTRTQGEQVLFGDSIFGGNIIPSNLRGRMVGIENTNTASPNVVVSGWQVYDNKGRVVEKYEPFFSVGWEYKKPQGSASLNEFGQKATMFYDPLGRVIRTLYPDRSEQLVVHGVPGTIQIPDVTDPHIFEPTPWEAYTYDANDNAGRTQSSTLNNSYQNHFNTPTSVEVDALGRAIKSIDRNGPDANTDWYITRSVYDMQGNLLSVTDALGRKAFVHIYDLAKRMLRVESIDAGTKQSVLDVVGNTTEQRDSKGALILFSYDVLNRPLKLWARDGLNQNITLRQMLEYGDDSSRTQSTAGRDANKKQNRLGKLYKHYDEAGPLTFKKYDFKGNVLEKTRQCIKIDKITSVFNGASATNWNVQPYRIDWEQAGATIANDNRCLFDTKEYSTSLTYDALNRIKEIIYPQAVDGNRKKVQPQYNRAGGVEKVKLDDAIYVERIAYNAKGQRTLIAYGNMIMTRYTYDPQTFRLLRLRSERYENPIGTTYTYQPALTNSLLLQDFSYEYDLAGSILKVKDRSPRSGVTNSMLGEDALDKIFTYDPLYRLLSASGRECTRILNPSSCSEGNQCCSYIPGRPTPNQNNAPSLTSPYKEQYQYDAAGNMLSLLHQNLTRTNSSWTRHFGIGGYKPQDWAQEWQTHLNGALGWANVPGNQLTHVGNNLQGVPQTHFYDENGNLITENTDRHYEWDHSDRMRVFRNQTTNAEPTIHAHYFYDSTGQRVMKLVRKKGEPFEITVYIDDLFEHHIKGTKENSSLHVMDDQSRIALVRIGTPFETNDTTPDIQYHLGDHLNSSSVVIDGNGSWINHEEYFPYGETSLGSFAYKRYRYTGKECDQESGLCYYGARYYSTWLGKWINCDLLEKLGSGQVLNRFSYVLNSPIRYIDPLGLENEETSRFPNQKPPELPKGSYFATSQQLEAARVHGATSQAGAGNDPLTGQPYRPPPVVMPWYDRAIMWTADNIAEPALLMLLTSPALLEWGLAKTIATSTRAEFAIGAGVRGLSPELQAGLKSLPAKTIPTLPAKGGRVVNIGGELEARVGEIVINPGRATMPLARIAEDTGAIVIQAKAEAIPLKSSSASKVIGNKLPAGVIDWNQAGPEIGRILERGGTVELSSFGPEGPAIKAGLKAGGVESTVDPLSKGRFVFGSKL